MQPNQLHNIQRQGKDELILSINGATYVWKQEFIIGSELKELAGIDPQTELYLSVQKPWEDELIINDTHVNLARPEIEHFYSKRNLKYTINDEAFESYRQYVKGDFLREQGHFTEDDDLFLKVEKPWEDELIGAEDWVDLARPGTEHFISKCVDFLLIVDGREKRWRKRKISFEEVVVLAKGSYQNNETTIYTVTFDRGPKQNPEGSMQPEEVVFIKNKMIFNVTATDKS